jgi:hypothetical protein
MKWQCSATRPVEFPKADAGDGRLRVYSVEKLTFGAEAIFEVYRNTAENPSKTRRTAE